MTIAFMKVLYITKIRHFTVFVDTEILIIKKTIVKFFQQNHNCFKTYNISTYIRIYKSLNHLTLPLKLKSNKDIFLTIKI